MSNEVGDLIDRISDESDLCRNDGEDDIADLLREAGGMIIRLNRIIVLAKHKLENADGPAMVRDAYETLRSNPLPASEPQAADDVATRYIEGLLRLADRIEEANETPMLIGLQAATAIRAVCQQSNTVEVKP